MGASVQISAVIEVAYVEMKAVLKEENAAPLVQYHHE